MSTLGQKIKETFTGHHDQGKRDVKTPDVNAPGAFPSDDSATKHHSDQNKLTKEPPQHIGQETEGGEEKGAQHHTGHAHHDPEPETKQATSDAGNYPYWGDLPREGGQHVHRSGEPDSDTTKKDHVSSNEPTLATGAPTADASTIGTGYPGSDKLKDNDTSKGDETTRADPTEDSNLQHASKGAGVAGLAGATYLAATDKDDAHKTEHKQYKLEDANTPTDANKSKTVEETKTLSSTQKPVDAATPTKTTSAGDNNSHRKEEEALAAGAGVAGLAGAGFYASQQGDKKELEQEKRDNSSHTAWQSHSQTSSHTRTPRLDPTTEAQKATSAAGNYPYWKDGDNWDKSTNDTKPAEAATPSKTTSSGDNDTHRREKEALKSGAGASGLAGAGYMASRDQGDHGEDKRPSSTPGQATSQDHEHHRHASGHPDRENFTKRATSGAENHTQWDDQKKENNNKGLAAAGLGGTALAETGYLASKGTDESKGKLLGSTRETSSGVAAPDSFAEHDTTSRYVEPTSAGGIHNTVVGAGSSEHSHPAGSSDTTSARHQTTTASQAGQPAAQAAALQAWNKGQPDSSNPDGDNSRDSKHSHLKYAAAGTAFSAGAAGIAADYGQGKDHEESPRSNQAEKVAERALGSDGKPHAPSATEGSGSTDEKSASSAAASGVTGFAGHSGSAGKDAKVFHNCDKCGHTNDISRYFDKDAVFRSQ
ncbi:hypothetical protein KVR01_004445 [Diaporthe batatas]|uniref:uncharacterized protein n=1 Tax=Diaporthe batatas TaxID=748121 RepID=UPI001D04DFC9|nr:uncharacterized protein KVR01_004445 [Diaporthe batatas]KAG8165893.1 hypothetical protein KVR01_004445 [Diaporthe batatas]